MPIRNMGTLLENIVVVEAVRAFARAKPPAMIEFLNSFAMPPLSQWGTHATDYGFSAAQLNSLQTGPRPGPSESYQGLLWSCLQQPQGQVGTMGPNGALLCGLLAHHLQCPIRFWLNDIPHGHYGNALPGLTAINAIVQQVLALPAAPAAASVVCGEPWPSSLTSPNSSLTDAMADWTEPPHARVGFLDPMRYRINDGRGGESDSLSHQQWLRLLATGHPCPVISVHFTGHNNWTTLRPEIQSMHGDGIATGYPYTVVSRHSYYHAVCNIRSPEGTEAACALAIDLRDMVRAAWSSWFRTIGRAADHLDVVIL